MEATIIWSGFGGRMSFLMTPTAAVCRISPLPLCHGPPTPSAISRPSFFFAAAARLLLPLMCIQLPRSSHRISVTDRTIMEARNRNGGSNRRAQPE